jgi:hypothetical protein
MMYGPTRNRTPFPGANYLRRKQASDAQSLRHNARSVLRHQSVVSDLSECADRNERSVQNQFGLTSERDVSGCPPMVKFEHARQTHIEGFRPVGGFCRI